MPKNTFYNLPCEKKKRIIEGAKVAFSQKHYNEVTIDLAFIISSTVLNQDKYILENDKDHGEVLKNVCEILEIGLKKRDN